MEMWRDLFVDLLAHERNGYRRFLSADIKHLCCLADVFFAADKRVDVVLL